MNLTLYNPKTENIMDVWISELSELNNLIEIYFNINKPNQNITINGNKLNMTKLLNESGLNSGDMIVVDDNDNENDIDNNMINNTINTQTNALDEHMDNMISQAQIAHSLIYIKGECNDIAFKIVIDSGAQSSIMSNYMAEFLGISHKMDKRMSGVANGIGTTKILGCIIGCDIKINNSMFIPINLTIIDNDVDKHLVIFGLEFLYTYG